MGISSLLRALLGNQPLFTLDVKGAHLRVARFSGREGMSSLFDFRLELAGPELELASLVDKPALLRIEGVEAPRLVHGVISAAEYVGETRSLQLYEVDLVPWIWRLRLRHDCRIFHDRSTPQILEEVLTGAGLAKTWLRLDLVAEYAPRNYCVQYHESDLAFISRLMEEDGIFYFFEHEADKHIVVLADHPGAHKPIPGLPALWYRPPGGDMVADREHVQSFRFGERIRPGKVSLRDHNLHNPDVGMEVYEAAKLHADLEIYQFPGEYQDPALGAPHQGQSIARTRLEAAQVDRRAGSGTSDCPRVTAGHTFDLVGHSRGDLDAAYRIVQVTHNGNQPQVLDQDASGDFSYSNEFAVMEKSQPFRSAQQTPKPRMKGLQTATVVGAEGEEVDPDEHGRVKVKFHWDRSKSFDETSSCWVRVSQLWAGNSWGTMFIPRIGHEVLVDFIEGDPDRPIVVGRIHTGNNKPRYELPAGKTRTTLRSESSPGGGGFNELSFEDEKDREEMFLHAQKDLNLFAKDSMTQTIGNNRSTSIGSNESVDVGASRSVNVATNDATTVGVQHSVTIAPPPPVVIQFPEVAPSPLKPQPTSSAPPTSLTMSEQLIVLSNGEEVATITIKGPDVTIKASGKITIDAGGDMALVAGGALTLNGASVGITARERGDVVIQGGPMVKINC